VRRAESPFGSGGRAESGAPEARFGFAGFDKAPLTPLFPALLWKLVRSASTEGAVPVRAILSPKSEGQFSEFPKPSSLAEDRVVLLRKDVRDMAIV
jgi:hypothetical protein